MNNNNQFNQYNQNQYGQQYGQNTQYTQYDQQFGQNTQYNQYNPNSQYGQYSQYQPNGYGAASVGKQSQGATISAEKYNTIIGLCLAWGFLVNCVLCAFGEGIVNSLIDSGSVVGFFIGYIVCVLIGTLMVHGSDNPVVSFIGYNLIVVPMGICLSIILTAYVATGYSSIISIAFGITCAITVGMMVLSNLFPQFFLSLGKTLFLSLLLTIVIEVVLLIAGAPLGVIDYIVVLIFAGYIGYDWAVAQNQPKTVDNAVDSACELYIDIINLFIRLLRILANSRR